MPTLVWSLIENQDLRLMRRCNNWLAPKWVRIWMLCATRGGDGWLWYTLGLALCVFGGEGRFQAVGASFLAASTGIGVFLALKKLTGRKRPCAIAQHAWATLLPPDQFSFPSGHTLTAFAVITPLIGHYPGLTPHLSFCAASIAASRVILGMHFLSDVVAGAIIGAMLGYFSNGLIAWLAW